MITVLLDRYVPSPWSGKVAKPGAVLALDLSEALARTWPTDAHFCAYEPIEVEGEIVRLAIESVIDVLDGVRMVTLVGDIDDPETHGTPEPARPEWRESLARGLAASELAHYETRGGYRVLAQLRDPFVLTGPADADRWKALYSGWCDELERTHGLVLDRACKDWTRLYRLPNVMREGKRQRAAIVGTPPVIGTPLSAETHTALATGIASAKSDMYSRARALAQRLAPSVSGHDGDTTLFKAACELATVLTGDASAIETVLVETFNPRCAPPWPASKIAYEAGRAAERYNSAEMKFERATPPRMRPDAPREPVADPDAAAFGIPSDTRMVLDTNKKGEPLNTQRNVLRLIEQAFDEHVRYEECAGRIVCAGIDPSLGRFPDGEWSDEHTTALVVLADSQRLHVSPAMCDRAVALYAHMHSFNSLADFMAQCALAWDGVPRVNRFLATHWGAVDDAASIAVSRVFLLSMAARGLQPGAKVDTCPVLIGEQGIRKSSGLEALAGAEWFSGSPLPIGDKDAMQNIRGKLLWEFGEHASVNVRERNTVKAFLAQRSDRFRASYGRHAIDVPRTCTFASTTNEADVLNDPTGARRFLIANVTCVDVDAILRDREQLLGEAATRVIDGEQHWPTRDEELALQPARDRASAEAVTDPWEEPIAAWLDAKPAEFEFELTRDLFTQAVPVEMAHVDKRAQMRAANVLRRLGWVRCQRGDKRQRMWRRS